jgi:hypothetical protein
LRSRGNQLLDELVGLLGGRERFLGDKLGIEISKTDACRLGSDRDTDHTDASLVEVQKSRPSSSRRMTIGAFRNPTLVDELFDDDRNRASLKTGVSREISSRIG